MNTYIGVNGVAEQVTAVYVGVNGVAQRVEGIYAGVSGVAQKVYFTGGLPGIYQQVEYIRSSGGAYINTGIAPNKNVTKVEAIVKCNLPDETGNPHVFGCNDSSSNRFKMYTKTSKMYYGFSGSTGVLMTINSSSKYKLVLNAKSVSASIQVMPSGNINSTSLTNGTLPNKPIYLFANCNGESGYANPFYGDVFSFKIFENNVAVMDLYPCYRKSDSTVGFYDIVGGGFYTNLNGDGRFSKGPDVEPTPL